MNPHEGIQKATGLDVLAWFDSGAREVIGDTAYLNAINVFPVADGDTGSNLAATLRAMVRTPDKKAAFNGAIADISRSGMSGARGNSGIIFACYVNGIALEAKPFEMVSVSEFAQIAKSAVKYLYDAIESPVEGTMITVIREWADDLVKNSSLVHSFEELLKNAYKTAQASLERTKEQLEILKKHKVVDSGAAGFLRFLRGINQFLSGVAAPDAVAVKAIPTASLQADTLAYRYCTQALIRPFHPLDAGELKAAISTLKEEMRAFGDSLIVTSQGEEIKMHIHTNQPEEVVDKARAHGRLVSQKADDMQMQTDLQKAGRQKLGILTDSAADIPDRFKLAHHIGTLHLGVLIGDEVFLDKETIKLKQVFQAMDAPGVYPTSSQAEPARVEQVLGDMLDKFDHVLVLSVAQKLSGTYQSFLRACDALGADENRVTVLDTKLNSGAQGLMVMQAARMIKQGEPLETIVETLNEMIPNTKIYVCLNTLRYAVRGGRVPNTVGKIGMALKLRPIMSLDAQGKGTAFGAAFSQKGLTRKIFNLVKKAMNENGIYAYAITHGDNLPLARAYADELTRITGKAPEFICEISAAIALHAGPGTVAVSYTLQKEA